MHHHLLKSLLSSLGRVGIQTSLRGLLISKSLKLLLDILLHHDRVNVRVRVSLALVSLVVKERGNQLLLVDLAFVLSRMRLTNHHDVIILALGLRETSSSCSTAI